MEEEKAAEYYEEVTRKGQSAARFKQGLGFSSSTSNSNSSNSIYKPQNHHLTFVKATTSPSATCHQKQSQLLSIHNKLTRKDRDRDIGHRRRRRSCSRDRDRSNSDRESRRTTRTSVSPSPEKNIRRGYVIQETKKKSAKLIHGYGKMSPAERVKAKMKFQLTETAEKDAMNGMGSGWERFEFDKEAPLDDEEMEVADDDVALVKHIGQSFRFSAVEANREDKIKAAHDEAMFGSSRVFPSIHTEGIIEQENESTVKGSTSATNLLSDKVIAGQQGSWRDRARKA